MMDILVFESGGARYGVDAAVVSSVIRAVAISALPGAPGIVEGVFDLRGTLTPLLDIRARFGHGHKAVELSDRFIVVHAGRRMVALHADATEGIVSVDRSAMADVQRVVPQSPWIAGTASLPDGLVLIHDVETFLTAAETETLAESLAAVGARA